MAIDSVTTPPVRHLATFTSSGTFVVPEDLTQVFVSIVGASGGGTGGNQGFNNSGAAGGVGVLTSGWVQVPPGGQIAVTVGAGGSAGAGQSAPSPTPGAGSGGTTSFEGALRANGGQGSPTFGGGSNGSVGAAGTGVAVTSLPTLNPGNTTTVRVSSHVSQNTGGLAGGNGGIGQNQQTGNAGSAGSVRIFG